MKRLLLCRRMWIYESADEEEDHDHTNTNGGRHTAMQVWKHNMACCLVQISLMLLTAVALVVASFWLGILWRVDLPLVHSTDQRDYWLARVVRANNRTLRVGWKARYNPTARHYSSSLGGPFTVSNKAELVNGAAFRHSLGYLLTLARKRVNIPLEFDARLRWPNCSSSLWRVTNQGWCGNSWAHAVTSMISDRICIGSMGKIRPQLSVNDLTSCCTNCTAEGFRCSAGATASAALNYWLQNGIVTGGDFASSEGCKPQPWQTNCGMPCSMGHFEKANVGACVKSCQNRCHKGQYEADLWKAERVYWLWFPSTTTPKKRILSRRLKGRLELLHQLIQKELLLFGPVVICYLMDEDMQIYSSGVYRKIDATVPQLYTQCGRLLGWGRSNVSTEFWTVSNSWGRDWAELGSFRAVRDSGQRLESDLIYTSEILAGQPRLVDHRDGDL